MFRYLAARWRHRSPSDRRYIRSGLGLENRSHEQAFFWSEHFSRSRAAQARWAKECGGNVLTVLGAGPLRDFNSNALSSRFKRFRLVDANPVSPSYWTRLNTPIEPVIADISGCIDKWAEKIGSYHGTWEQTLALIRELGSSPTPSYSPQTDGLLSLNILSQLDVGWQEAVEPILRRRFGRSFVRQREQEWLAAILPGSQTLAEQHLAGLEASSAQSVLLITDVEYVEYTGRVYSRKRYATAPLTWSESGWTADPGIEYETTPGLEGVELNVATFKRWMPSYQLAWHEGWLWHIAPNGTEKAAHGKLHRVGAFALERYRESTSE